MSEHLSPHEQSCLISRTLEPGQALRAFAHLTECPACRTAVSRWRGRAMLHLQIEGAQIEGAIEWTPAHLEYDQLAAYVAHGLAEVEREIADNHLAVCEFCAQEVRELTAFNRELARRQPLAANGWWTSFKQSFTWSWASPALAGALLLLIGLAGWWRWRDAVPTQTARQTTPAPVAPTAPAALPATTNARESLLALTDHGQTLALKQDGQLESALDLPAAYRETLAVALAQQRLPLPAVLKTLAAQPRTLKSGERAPPSFAVYAPAGRVLQTNRPVFRWQTVAGASSYTVAVFDEDFNPVQTSATLTQTQWRAAQPLPRGRVYLWQVTAQVGDKQFSAPAAPAPEARFQILSQAKLAELQRAQRSAGQSHLLRATLYAQAGLLDEAARALQALQAENPQSPLVKKLLQQVR